MALTKDVGRQWPLTAVVPFTFADADGVTVEAMDIPGNAYLSGGYVVIVNAWDSATSAVLEVGDKTTTDRFVGTVDAKAAGGTPLVPAGAKFSVKDAVTLTITNTGAPSVGDGYLVVEYVIADRSQENGV